MSHSPLPPFAAYAGARRPKMLIVGEAWGSNEERLRKPLVGESGRELFRMMLEAGWRDEAEARELLRWLDPKWGDAWLPRRDALLERWSIGLTNVFQFRPPANKLDNISIPRSEIPKEAELFPTGNRGLYIDPQYHGEFDRLAEEIEATRPNLILAAGNTACQYLLRTQKIGSIRGAITQTSQPRIAGAPLKCLPTYHPAGMFRQWSWRPIIIADLMKAKREAQFPEIRRASRKIFFDPTLDEVRKFVDFCLTYPIDYLGVDTETSLGLIDTISFAPSRDRALVCQLGPHRVKVGSRYETIWPQRDGQMRTSYWEKWEEIEFWCLVKRLLESDLVKKVGQNFLYDMQYLLRAGIGPRRVEEDPMLLHHSLFPEMQKGLGFLGSIYSNEPAWKLMRGKHEGDSEKRDE